MNDSFTPSLDYQRLQQFTQLISNNDSGLGNISTNSGSKYAQSNGLKDSSAEAHNKHTSDNLFNDSALGTSFFHGGDISWEESDSPDASLLGIQQTRVMLNQDRVKSWTKERTKSLGEEIAEAAQRQRSELESTCCQQQNVVDTQMDCETCGEMTVSDENCGHTLTTVNKEQPQRITEQEARLEEMRKQVEQLRQNRDQLLQQGKLVESELASRKDFLHKLVDRWFAKTTQQVQTILTDESAYLEAKIKTLEQHIRNLQKDSEQFFMESTDRDLVRSVDVNQNIMPDIDRRIHLILGAGSSITHDMLGNLAWCLTDVDTLPAQVMTPAKLIRQFDSRRRLGNRHTGYMASGLSLGEDNNSLIITDLGTDSVQICDTRGNLQTQLNLFPFENPTKAVRLHDGRIAVACKNAVKIFSARGEYQTNLYANLFCPSDVAVNRNGDIVVTDMGERQAWICTYARADHRLLDWIVGGVRAPAFRNAWRVSVNKDDSIIVSDFDEHCIKIFTPSGILLCEFGQRGAGIGQFFHPAGTCVDQFGNILVADSANHRVQMFSQQGDFLAVVVCDQDLESPIDVAVNDHGDLFVLLGSGEVRVYQYLK